MDQDDCGHGFIDQVMAWLDERQQSYLAWGWVVSDCRAEPALIGDRDGTPTQTFGQGFRDHLAAITDQHAGRDGDECFHGGNLRVGG